MRGGLIIGLALMATISVVCGGPDQRIEPALATLTIAGSEQTAGLGSYCWRDEKRGRCADAIGISTAREPLLTGSPFTGIIRLPVERPVAESQLNVYLVTAKDQLDSEDPDRRWWSPTSEAREQLTSTPEREAAVELSLEPGLYVLSLFTRWAELGDAGYGFLVEVR